jgi:hypothetical protein
VDISRGGIQLRLRRRFERGSLLTLELKASNAEQSCTAIVRVVHVRAHGEGIWSIGCSFFRPLGAEDLAALLSSSQPEAQASGDTVVTRLAAITRAVKLPLRREP